MILLCFAKAKVRKFPSTGPVSIATRFNQEVFVDYLKVSSREELLSGVVSIIDAYSRYATWTEVSGPVTAAAVVTSLRNWRAEFGSPMIIRCDRGSENLNRYVASFCDEHNVVVQFGSAGHPQSQSLVERVHRTLLMLLRTLKEQYPSMTLSDRLTEARRVYLRRHHSALGMSPLERKETDSIPAAEESDEEQFGSDIEEMEEPISFGVSAGDPVLWKKVSSGKDEFGFAKGRVTKELGRGAYVFVEDGKSRERIVNRDRLVPLAVPPMISVDESPRRSARNRRPPSRYGFENESE